MRTPDGELIVGNGANDLPPLPAGAATADKPTTMQRILDAARAYCEAHKEDYETMRDSDSMDVDAEFMLLYQAVFQGVAKPTSGKQEQEWTPERVRAIRKATNSVSMLDWDEAIAKQANASIAAKQEETMPLVDALHQIGLLAGSSYRGDPPFLKLEAITRRCEKEIAQWKEKHGP